MVNPENPNKHLSAAERALMLKVFDGESSGLVAQFLYFLDLHAPRFLLCPILERLIKDQLTGKKLAEILEHEYPLDFLGAYRAVLAKVTREKPEAIRIIAGQNFNRMSVGK